MGREEREGEVDREETEKWLGKREGSRQERDREVDREETD
jgi:hypothetical protein